MQNIKLDIVYYLTNTDFEMEFNLGGCCPMRLFTESAGNAKDFLTCLSRAVSRSKVLLVCGSLFGNEGLINLTAKAIGKDCVPVDAEGYRIDTNDDIYIIDGSIPLVTSDGIFGGCIIESGPQTMIILTENREIRKTLLQTLIHPYIKELSILELSRGTGLENIENLGAEIPSQNIEYHETLAEEQPEEISEVTDTAEEKISENQDFLDETTEDTEEIFEDEPQEQAHQDILAEEPVYIEEPQIKEVPKKHQKHHMDDNYATFVFEDELEEDTQSDSNIYLGKDEVLEDDDFEEENSHRLDNEVDDIKFQREASEQFIKDNAKKASKKKAGNKSLNISIIIITILLFLILAAVAFIVLYLPYKEGISTEEYLKNIMQLKHSIRLFKF